MVLEDLGYLYQDEGKYAEAEPAFDRAVQNLSRQFEYSFSYMSEKDRLEFLQHTDSTLLPKYFSFCLKYGEKDTALLGKMYDVVLWEKGLVGSSLAALRAQVAATGDPQAIKLFEALTVKKGESAF
jgi:tetratricopeptide (TPR) repeat protein